MKKCIRYWTAAVDPLIPCFQFFVKDELLIQVGCGLTGSYLWSAHSFSESSVSFRFGIL